MRVLLIVPVLLGVAFAGCVLEEPARDPIAPGPMDDETSPPTTPDQGIAPGEPNPNAPRTGFRDLYRGEWCYYDDDRFDGRVFGSQKEFNETWTEFLECYPEADPVAFPKVDWKREFVAALIPRPSGCGGATLNVTHASANDGRYLVQYDHDTNDGKPCAAVMSRPIVFIGMDRMYEDKLDVDFVEVEQ